MLNYKGKESVPDLKMFTAQCRRQVKTNIAEGGICYHMTVSRSSETPRKEFPNLPVAEVKDMGVRQKEQKILMPDFQAKNPGRGKYQD